MAFGDDATATTPPVAGPPLTPPTTAPGYPTTPPPWPGAPGIPAGAAPGPVRGPRTPRRSTARNVLVVLLLVASTLVGAAGGVLYSRIADEGTTSATGATRTPGTPSTTVPSGPSSPFPDGPSNRPGGPFDQPAEQPSDDGSSDRAGADADADAVAAKVVPGVVNINTLTAQGQGAGTGMVLTSSGTVLTNNHVISGATRIQVVDADTGESYDAEVVGAAPTMDVAVLKLEGASGLDTVATGDSDDVATGDAVVAIGNAGGDGGLPSVVTGNVVATGRSITASDPSGSDAHQLSDLIQVDAPIESGDSGGPLANADGEVIGINTAASTDRRGSATGEGYAVPINTALDIAEQIESGKASATVRIGVRGVLGVQVVPAGSSRSGSNRSGGGAEVAGVASGSGAAEAGVTAGSVITSLDGERIGSAEDLTAALSGARPGDEVELGWTDGSGADRTATVTLVEGPPE